MVYYNRQWGTVCDDHFGSDEADTACRSMGYAGAIRHSNTRSERSYTGNFQRIKLSDWLELLLYRFETSHGDPLYNSANHKLCFIFSAG